MKNTPYKFTILDKLRKLPVEEYEVALKWLPETLGITSGTFRNWQYTKSDDKLELPATAVLKLSTFFGCEPRELFTNQVDQERLISDWNSAKEENISKPTLFNGHVSDH